MSYLRRLMTEQERAKSFATHPRKMMSRLGGPCCDCCGADDPIYLYSSERMITGEWLRCWRWAACATCAELIEAGRWSDLRERTRAAVRAMGNYEQDQAAALAFIVDKLWNNFRSDATTCEVK